MSLFTARPVRASVFGLGKPRRLERACLLTASCVLLPALYGCGNPAIDVIVATLGAEDPNVKDLANHRPGQPCLACHGPYYGASPRMSIAGTIFAKPATEDAPTTVTPVQGAYVRLFDTQLAVGKGPVLESNCSGNFYATYDDFKPLFPVAVRIECPDHNGDKGAAVPRPILLTMQSRISREGSCNYCHRGARDAGSPGWVTCDPTRAFFNAAPEPSSECKGRVEPWFLPPLTGGNGT